VKKAALIAIGAGIAVVGGTAFALTQEPVQATIRGLTGNESAADVLRKYWGAERCSDRTEFILSPDENKKFLDEHYRNGCSSKFTISDSAPCEKELGVGKSCLIDAKDERGQGHYYCMTLTEGGFKVDWQCSVGFSPIPIAAFKAQRAPKSESTVRAIVRLSDMFPYEVRQAQDQLLSIYVGDETGNSLYALVKKDSEDGKKFFDALKDGRNHALTVKISYPERINSADYALGFWVKDGWESN
jgi:hypothetical protein